MPAFPLCTDCKKHRRDTECLTGLLVIVFLFIFLLPGIGLFLAESKIWGLLVLILSVLLLLAIKGIKNHWYQEHPGHSSISNHITLERYIAPVDDKGFRLRIVFTNKKYAELFCKANGFNIDKSASN